MGRRVRQRDAGAVARHPRFFDGIEGERDDLQFARGFGKLMGTLNKRWTREEVRLYPAYDAHCSAAKKAG